MRQQSLGVFVPKRKYCRRRYFGDINLIYNVQRQQHGSICLNVLRLARSHEPLLSKSKDIFSSLGVASLACKSGLLSMGSFPWGDSSGLWYSITCDIHIIYAQQTESTDDGWQWWRSALGWEKGFTRSKKQIVFVGDGLAVWGFR